MPSQMNSDNLFQTELAEPVATKGTQAFVHIALLPREDGEDLCAISQCLTTHVPKEDAFYILPNPTPEPASLSWTQIISAVVKGNPPIMPKCVSYPHATLLHVWMEQAAAEALLDAFSRTAEGACIPQLLTKGMLGCAGPRWRGGELLPTQIDYACSGIVAKTDSLLALQEWAKSLIPSDSDSRIVTGTGDLWKPHFTLLVLQGKEGPSFAEADCRDIVIESPILAIGTSNLYGQFKMALAVAGADIQPTPPGKSIPMLRKYFGTNARGCHPIQHHDGSISPNDVPDFASSCGQGNHTLFGEIRKSARRT